MHVALREWDFDSSLCEFTRDFGIDLAANHKPVIQLGPEAQAEVERTVAESIKGDQRLGVFEDIGMRGGDSRQDSENTIRIGTVSDANNNVRAPVEIGERPVHHGFTDE